MRIPLYPAVVAMVVTEGECTAGAVDLLDSEGGLGGHGRLFAADPGVLGAEMCVTFFISV